MKSKNTKTPARKSRAAKPVVSSIVRSVTVKPDPEKNVVVSIHPRFVEFRNEGETEAYSRIPYGAEGSDARQQAEAAIAGLESAGIGATILNYDAQGREVAFAS